MEPSCDFGMEPFRSVPSGSQTEHILSVTSIWNCAATKKGKRFAWLMLKGRIKVRTILFNEKLFIKSYPFGCQEETRQFCILRLGEPPGFRTVFACHVVILRTQFLAKEY
jgi:hypothetical protein